MPEENPSQFHHPLIVIGGLTTDLHGNQARAFGGYFMYHETNGNIFGGKLTSPWGDSRITGGLFNLEGLTIEAEFISSGLPVHTKYKMKKSDKIESYSREFINNRFEGLLKEVCLNTIQERAYIEVIDRPKKR